MQQGTTTSRPAGAFDGFGPNVRCSTPHGSIPLFVEPASPSIARDLKELIAIIDQREVLEQVLLEYGAVVFRGFPVHGTDDFLRIVDRFPEHAPGYAGGATPRAAIKGRAMEATRAGSSRYLKLHQEMSYLPNHPRLLAFYCRLPAESGGATVIADMRAVTAALPDPLMEALKAKGVRYKRNLLSPDADDGRLNPVFGHNNWVANFGTDDREEVERLCADRGLAYEWLADGSLDIVNDRPATIEHPVTGDLLYFNQAHVQIFRQHAYGAAWEAAKQVYGDTLPRVFDASFADGSPISDDDLSAIHASLDAATVSFPWQAGDIMLVENKLVAHGREPFTGDRDVQVALID